MPGNLQYVIGIKAFAVHLVISQMVALNRVQKQIAAMIDIVISSKASLLKYILRLYQALEAWEMSTTEKLLQAPSVHVDETSFRVDEKNHWIHVYSSGGTTLKLLHRSRGKKAIVGLNIIPKYGGGHHSRLLGLLFILRPLRPWPLRFAFAERADIYCEAWV